MPQPINASRAIECWDAFDEKVLDFNPTFLAVSEHRGFVFFRREAVPPCPGNGSIWYVPVDTASMRPLGAPRLIVERGEDPRVIRHGVDVYLFFVQVERDESNGLKGSSIALTRLIVDGDGFRAAHLYVFPKDPAGIRRGDAHLPNWEKNWVPLSSGDDEICVIYSHDPWCVIAMDVADPDNLRLSRGAVEQGVAWAFGSIRGGTPPLPYREGELVSFFHSSMIVGAKRLYFVGAIVIEDTWPFKPLRHSRQPLLASPYHSDIRQYGWGYPSSAIFPAGAVPLDDGRFRVVCGIQDGRIGFVDITKDELESHLSQIDPLSDVYSLGSEQRLPRSRAPLLEVPRPVPGVSELAVIRFVQMMMADRRKMVDIGAHIGFYSVALSGNFKEIHAFEPSNFQFEWLQKNIRLNGLTWVNAHRVALSDKSGCAQLSVLSEDGGGNTLCSFDGVAQRALDSYPVELATLDSFAIDDLDFLKIDVEGHEMEVLAGARSTIMSSRPVILIEVWNEPSRRAAIERWATGTGYTLEFRFEQAPELALMFPSEMRQAFAWFV